MDNDRRHGKTVEVDSDVRIALQIQGELGRQVLHRLARIEQRIDDRPHVGDVDLRPGRRPGRRILKIKNARLVRRTRKLVREKLSSDLRRRAPLDVDTKRKGLEASAPVTAVETATGEPGPLSLALPAAAQVAERLVSPQRVNARAIVGDADRLHRTERIGDEIDLDLLGIGVKGVPDEFLNRCERRPLEKRFDVVSLCLNVDLFHEKLVVGSW